MATNLKPRENAATRPLPATDKALVNQIIGLRNSGDAGGAKRVTFYDDAARGLRLVVGGRSAVWKLNYRPRGAQDDDGKRPAQRAATLGEFAVGAALPANYLTIAAARAKAFQLRDEIKEGADPLGERQQARVARKDARAAARNDAAARRAHIELLLSDKPVPAPNYTVLAEATMGECAEIYRKRAPRKKATLRERSRDDAHRFAARALEAMEAADMRPGELDKGRIDNLANTQTPAQAVHMIGEIMRILRWLYDHDALDRLPQVKTPKPPPSRKRFYSAEEIQKVWLAAANTGDEARADYLRAVILLPLRRMELATAKAGDVISRDSQRVIALTKTKNDEPFLVPLKGEALAIIERRIKGLAKGDLIFPVRNSWSDWYEQLRELSGVADFRLHDLRRTFSSQASANGLADIAMVDKCLNHKASVTHGGVLGVYQQSDLLEKRASIFEAWGTMIARAVATGSFKPADNVTPLRREA
jgi:integrase